METKSRLAKCMIVGVGVVMFLFLLVVLSTQAFAESKTLTFAWESGMEPDLARFEIDVSTDAVWSTYTDQHTTPDSGTWNRFCDVPIIADTLAYIHDAAITVPDGSEGDYFFRIRALDASGNASIYCYGTADGPCKTRLDFKPPQSIVTFTVVVVPE